jgi:hypothetical protein
MRLTALLALRRVQLAHQDLLCLVCCEHGKLHRPLVLLAPTVNTAVKCSRQEGRALAFHIHLYWEAEGDACRVECSVGIAKRGILALASKRDARQPEEEQKHKTQTRATALRV